MAKLKVGIIGTGNISGIYFNNGKRFESMEVVACADLDVERAKAVGQQYGVRGGSVDELLADPDIQMVINLTIPQAHAPVALQALEAGKHVYTEKPLAATREEGLRVLEAARSKGLRVGGAPDTFLGGGIQTCIKLIEDGEIGTPIGATAFMMGSGPEAWHPNPDFFYQPGGGPLFDMGPYYLTALIALLGPIARVTGSAKISFPERVATSEKLYGKKIKVETPTHIGGLLDFASGPMATLLTSFDINGGSVLPRIELYGSKGTLLVPDPNTFDGPVKLKRAGEQEWSEIPLTHGKSENARGIGAADMAQAIATGREHRASGDLAYHVLDAMFGILDSSANHAHYAMQSTCRKPAPFPTGLADAELDR
ncbi:oxidoreductase [Cohnella sp. CIP 111063]|uniref:Gfo/Idh/MocA family protein n=1 Tax=unclassified Cohnella TaxID=2636738 RepID=UPI000B8C4308|nr:MULTISPECIES: Gfo/Idh/MocA family oxidoreductase [unclassified Cohnella]OXS58061.1 oxidoreductase [Cohnella sp. CIP 111063]PRX71401.1 putative dehydrogenase [Cohnella sp. SGD-V74]